ncbi:MAG: hypothetical protein HYS18_10525 [Burkholderiales bacterium]|nr:hypothetical protein [Burkholderiales bacterium]
MKTYFKRRAALLIQLIAVSLVAACGGGGEGGIVTAGNVTTTTTASTTTTTASAGGPTVLYTDVISGPTSGGEGNNGTYLSIFGKNFGSSGLGTTTKVYLGNVEVASYRSLGTSKVPGMQQITVQVGSLGGAAQGVALPIKVTVGGVASNTNVTFMPNPGRILYVDNVAGNDATAVPGDITHPYRYVQTPALYTGGAWPIARAGDMIVMRGRGNANPWTDVGFENYFMRFRDKSGSAPTGVSGTGAIVLMGYPGEDTYIRGTLANGMTGGCVSAINGQSFPGLGQWVVIANLRLDCEGYDGPISQQIFGHNWRVINNDLSASTAPRTGGSVPRMAGITGNGNNAVWYGNHIHDIQGSAQECHGIYIDGDGSYDIAYNYIHDIRDGNGFQVYVNGGNGSVEANNINLHHNLIRDVSKHGVNLADGTKNNVNVWNNVVYNVQYAAIRFNTLTLSGAKIYNNTFYNTNQAKNSFYGALTNDWSLPTGAMDVENNIFYVAAGTPYNSGSVTVPPSAGTFTRNVWFNGTGNPSIDSAPVVLDPLFVVPGSDFHLQAASPAIGSGSKAAAVMSLVTTDFDLAIRSAATMDIGALKY